MTEYKRIQGKSYMIRNQTAAAADYEVNMLTANHIPGLLPLQITESSNEIQYWYEISGRQDLSGWAESHRLGSDFLKTLFFALDHAVEKAGEYLLSEDGFLLAPENIFINPEGSGILFCYVPYEKMAFEDSVRTFMEYYLQHMEHDRQEEIQKCYEVYDRCQGTYAGCRELLEILCRDTQNTERETAEELFADVSEKTETAEADEKEKTEKRSLLQPHGKFKFSCPVIRKKKAPEYPVVFEPEESSIKMEHPTVFLGSETPEILGELRYEGDGRAQNLSVQGDLFLIGSKEGEADGIIHASGISRIHAKIIREGMEYYMEDMNSTNGTYLNGTLLNYRQRVLLKKNDKIWFANEKFRFV